MSRIFICDLCGKPIAGKPSDHYRVKKIHVGWAEHWWQQIDVHEECLVNLLKATDKLKKGEQHEN